jgi:cation transport ATPase
LFEATEARSIRWRLLLGIFLTIPLLASSVDVAGGGQSFIKNNFDYRWFLSFQALLATIVVFFCGQPILLRAWKSLRTFRPNVFSMTGLSILSAYLFSMVALVYAWQSIPLLRPPAEASVKVAPVLKDGLSAIAPAAGKEPQNQPILHVQKREARGIRN